MTKDYFKYHSRKDNRLCVKCAKQLHESDGIMCQKCKIKHNAHRNDRRQMRVMLGLCSVCGKNKAEPNMKLCIECNGKQIDYYNTSGAAERRKSRQKEHDANKYSYRKENGLCTACGKSQKQHGLLCNSCYVKRKVNESNRMNKSLHLDRQSWYMIDKCYTCGGFGLVEGKKLCKKCYESMNNKRIIAMQVLTSESHKDKMHKIYEGSNYEKRKCNIQTL